MAKLTMSKMTIAAAQAERKALMEFVQRRGILEIIEQDDEAFFERPGTESQVAIFDRTAAASEQALEVLAAYSPEKKPMLSMLEGRKQITPDQYTQLFAKRKQVFSVVSDINALAQQLNECRAEITRLTAQLAELEPWLPLDISPTLSGTLRTAVFVGAVGYETEETTFAQQLAGKLSELAAEEIGTAVEIVSASREVTTMVVMTNRSASDLVGQALRSLGFTKPSNLPAELPRERYQKVRERREAILDDTDVIVSLIGALAAHREDIRFVADSYRMRAERYRAVGMLQQSKNVFILTGYVPERYAQALAGELEKRFEAAVEIEATDPADVEVPVVLDNGGFAKPVENITAMYSLPAPGDVDPTSLMSIFFYVFFGIMLSDAGYGLLLVIATAILLWKCPMEPRMRNNIKMFLYCGISTTFWGVLFGGFFGDLIPVFTREYLGHEVAIQPLWINPVEDPMTLLLFGIALGVVQIFVGMGVQFYQLCRQGKALDALLDVGSWYLVLIGAIGWLVGPMVGLETLGTVCMWLLIAGLALLVVFGGRKSPKLIGKIFGGIPKLYDITSYASDALSYSRLMALGLATGVIAQVFNLLGSLAGGLAGLLIFIPVFLIGHAINLGINALGAYVHTIRLQYVEFFSKFYEGGGRPFAPFTSQTKYVRFKED